MLEVRARNTQSTHTQHISVAVIKREAERVVTHKNVHGWYVWLYTFATCNAEDSNVDFNLIIHTYRRVTSLLSVYEAFSTNVR